MDIAANVPNADFDFSIAKYDSTKVEKAVISPAADGNHAVINGVTALASYDVSADKIPLANMYKYYVISPGKKMCRFDPATSSFVETALSYSRDTVKAVANDEYENITIDDITFLTSGFGAISGIPAGYTICVPGLPVGSLFKITDDPKNGYGLVGYERVMGTRINEDHSVEDIPSYHEYDGNLLNVGRVIADENPQLEVLNKKGYGITVNKKWSDLNITTAHSEVYTAVYVDGELLEGSVRQIKSPSTSAYYFWPSLVPYPDGRERVSLDGYEVKEVLLGNDSPKVASDGSVTDCGTVTPLEDGDETVITAVRTDEATPDGEENAHSYDYFVSYDYGGNDSSRVDTITNTREGGIAFRLFRWDSGVP